MKSSLLNKIVLSIIATAVFTACFWGMWMSQYHSVMPVWLTASLFIAIGSLIGTGLYEDWRNKKA